ncbi:hypothetical protein BH23ACT1_BH23ACT1_15380 [soil metagenome]
MTLGVVLAHGIGGRSDLPLPLWMFAYGAGTALLISFVALRVLWPRPRLDAAAEGRPAPGWTTTATGVAGPAGRVAGVVVFTVVLAAAAFGSSSTAANLAPVAVYVLFWVGLALVSAVVGDVWRVLSPWDTLAAVAARWRGRHQEEPVQALEGATHWPAAAGLFAFVWLELCYHEPASPRVLALALSAYAVAMLAGAARWGRAWLRTGDGFGVWFGLLATMAPLYRDDDGRLRGRVPFSGLASVTPRAGTAAVVLVVLGSTAFDGVTRSSWWADLVGSRSGWAATIVATIGLVWVIGIVALVFTGAMRLAARLTDREPGSLVAPFLHSLVPIALAYTVAHYFSLFVFEGQQAIALVSDPFGLGWNLFGTIDRGIDFRALSTTTIAYVQAGAIVIGHVVGVVVAHDRAVSMFDRVAANRSQEPLRAVMVTYTVGGLALLLGS